jgi:hypothetical protein
VVLLLYDLEGLALMECAVFLVQRLVSLILCGELEELKPTANQSCKLTAVYSVRCGCKHELAELFQLLNGSYDFHGVLGNIGSTLFLKHQDVMDIGEPALENEDADLCIGPAGHHLLQEFHLDIW